MVGIFGTAMIGFVFRNGSAAVCPFNMADKVPSVFGVWLSFWVLSVFVAIYLPVRFAGRLYRLHFAPSSGGCWEKKVCSFPLADQHVAV